MKNIFKKAQKGFTIIELVIVIGVIAILSAIMIPTFVNLTDKANKAALQNDLTATYSTYVTDASDGIYGDPEQSDEVLTLYSDKADIAIKDGADYYTRNDDGVWTIAELEADDVESVRGSGADYEVGNFVVCHIK